MNMMNVTAKLAKITGGKPIPSGQPLSFLLLVGLALLVAGCAGGEGPQEESYADEMVAQHEGDTAGATALTEVEPAVPVAGDSVSYGTVGGEELTGYLAQPARPDSVAQAKGLPEGTALPGLIVVHEWWGLNENVKTMARRLAGEGLQVLAVDLYGGQVASEPQGARRLVQAAMEDSSAMMANMRAASQYLRNELQAPRVGVLGWCFGGSVTMRTAVAMPNRVDAAVIYYGEPALNPEQIDNLDMPVLGLYGGQDGSIPVSSVDSFKQVLHQTNQQAEVYVYEEAGHAFANPSGENYEPEAAIDAWRKTTRFLQEHLFPSRGSS